MTKLADEIINLSSSDEYPLHMPGHKRQQTGCAPLDAAHTIDITEIKGYDNLYDAHGILREAMDYASKEYDCPHTYYLVNGSTVGILIAIHTVAAMYGRKNTEVLRDRILIASDCHRSVAAGAELAGLNTDIMDTDDIYIHFNSKDDRSGDDDRNERDEANARTRVRIDGGISCAYLEEKLIQADASGSRYAAVVITSPTYEGIISDIEVIADICHRYDTILIVDEAHGAHLDLSDAYPDGALRYGADIVIHSTHKTLAAMTQTALLHVQGNLVDITYIKKYWTMLQTSSPSYVLMASIDNALHHICSDPDLIKRQIELSEKMYAAGRNILKNIRFLTQDDIQACDSAVALDPCKVVVFTGKSDIDGYMLQEILLDEYHIQMELATDDYVLGIITYMDTEEGIGRFTDALCEIDARLSDGYYDGYIRSGSSTLAGKDNPLYAPCIL